MQRVNFLAKEYRLEPVRNEEMIGICDPEGERPAYSTSDKNSPDKWVATIKNTGNENIQFIPVDKNIVYYRDDGQKESSCDGMILYNDDSSICFVELKDVRTSGWISDAIDQLKETIKVIQFNIPIIPDPVYAVIYLRIRCFLYLCSQNITNQYCHVNEICS